MSTAAVTAEGGKTAAQLPNASANAPAQPIWKPSFNPWLIAASVMLATFMEVLDTSVANVALPHIGGNLSASPEDQIGNASGVFNLMRNTGGSIGIAAVTTLLARRASASSGNGTAFDALRSGFSTAYASSANRACDAH